MTTTTTIAKPRGISAAEWRLNIEAQALDHKNALFAKAPAQEQRVIIAQDVLTWLDEDKIRPAPGTYLSPYLRRQGGSYTDYEMGNDGAIVSGRVEDDRVDGGKCSACALGAVFACAVERTGGLQDFWYHGRQERMHAKLAPYFSEDQLQLIEAAFEKNDNFCTFANTFADRQLAQRAEDFGRQWTNDPKARMRAIMQNIVDNGGTFVP